MVFTLKRFCASRWAWVTFPVLSLVMLLTFSTSTSPCYNYNGDEKNLMHATQNEHLTRSDLFIHVGPLSYLINILGKNIGGTTGIFILQLIFNSFSLWMMYLTARLVSTPLRSMIAVVVGVIPYSFLFSGGNIQEEWMMPFITFAIYLTCRGITKHASSTSSKTPIFPFLLGICFGAVAMIRLNEAVSIIGGLMLGYCLWLISQRDIIQIFTALWMFICATAIVAPILFWLASIGALDNFWNATVSNINGITSHFSSPFVSTFIELPRIALLLLAALLGVTMWNTGNRQPIWPLLTAMLLGALLLNTNHTEQNYLVFVPFLVLMLSMVGQIRKGAAVDGPVA